MNSLTKREILEVEHKLMQEYWEQFWDCPTDKDKVEWSHEVAGALLAFESLMKVMDRTEGEVNGNDK